jgi:adenylyl- and sulfurtransferase ThiI
MCLALLVKEQIRGIGGFPSTSNGDILYRMSLLAKRTNPK